MRIDHGRLLWAALALVAGALDANAGGDPEAGARVYGNCAACHSLEPGRHMTGPSLAELWGRKAGGLPDFQRYSPAMKSAGVVWNEATLDEWLADPRKAVPGNRMTFAGIKDAKARADLIAFLAQATAKGAKPQVAHGGGMGGMMGRSGPTNLKNAGQESQVTAVTYCRETYHVTTAAGETHDFWEFNLRFKTDSSPLGPPAGKPVLAGAGMMGDRASIIFTAPAEISAFIKPGC
ncbi:MAG: c-type cytochrome [Rhodospirillales bacterium]